MADSNNGAADDASSLTAPPSASAASLPNNEANTNADAAVDIKDVSGEVEARDILVDTPASGTGSNSSFSSPLLARLGSWSKQAKESGKEFWIKRSNTSGTLAESIKKQMSSPLTVATLDQTSPPRPDSKSETEKSASSSDMFAEEKKTDNGALESEAQQQATTTEPNNNNGRKDDNAKSEDSSKVPPPPPPPPPRPAPVETAESSTNDENASRTNSAASLFRNLPSAALPSLLSPNSTLATPTTPHSQGSYWDDDDDASSYWSSTYSDGNHSSTTSMQRGTLKWAALVDSVSQSYRGRYNNSRSNASSDTDTDAYGYTYYNKSSPMASETKPSTPPRHAAMTTSQDGTPTQTHRILQSRAKQHLQELMQNELQSDHEYLLLLGQGMLGVNLKPTFVKHGGVHVDYLVPGGAAFKSGIVRPGDSLQRIGPLDVRRGNLLQVPHQIAQAKRPVHIVLATGGCHVSNVNYVDIATALLHELEQFHVQQSSSVVRFVTPTNDEIDTSVDTGDVEKEKAEPKEAEENKDDAPPNSPQQCNQEQVGSPVSPPRTIRNASSPNPTTPAQPPRDIPDLTWKEDDDDACLLRPQIPQLVLRQYFQIAGGQRCNEGWFRQPNKLWAAHSSSQNFVHSLQHAFCLTTADPRRLPFLVRHWNSHQQQDDPTTTTSPSKIDDGEDGMTTGQDSSSSFPNGGNGDMSPNAMLMLYLEIFQFVDLYGVTPAPRRREIAQKIAQKYFLPTVLGEDFIPPMLDFHAIVPGASLRALEKSLAAAEGGDEDGKESIPQDLFRDFSNAVLESLTELPFLDFLVGDECSRMRAYLRHTAPFLNVPLDQVIAQIVTRRSGGPSELHQLHAQNYLLYVLVYLVGLTDPEEVGETDDVVDVEKEKRSRVEDAAASICAAIFIQRHLLPGIDDYKRAEAAANDDIQQSATQALWNSWEQFWELFLSPTVGSLETTSMSAETTAKVQLLRSDLEQICAPCRRRGASGALKREMVVTPQITDSLIIHRLQSLAENLLYDYAVIRHSKFRAHKIHEWMSQESMSCMDDANQDESDPKEDSDLTPSLIPKFPSDCIKRLLRKATFPQGVSVHKPYRSATSTDAASSTETKDQPQDCTAECALVFGTNTDEEYSLMISSPTQQSKDIQRYVCEALGGDDPSNGNVLSPEEIPPTLEGYAVVPNSGIQFQQAFHDYNNSTYQSDDGWGLSLLSFKVPRADEGDVDASLYGVSLVLTRSDSSFSSETTVPSSPPKTIATSDESGRSNSEMAEEHLVIPTRVERAAGKSGQSEVRFEGSVEAGDLHRVVRMDADCALFNSKLQEEPSWSKQLATTNAMVGLAFVSRQNAIPSMREALSCLVSDFSSLNHGSDKRSLWCAGLADFLGTFSHSNVEPEVLKEFVQPYLKRSLKPWLERPFGAQQEYFENQAGEQLIQNLPPIPLALMFLTALMEQKIVITGSRRSVLLSATTALSEMLKPLKWCHLMVPRVPANLAGDLLQYPAPFILGMPAQDPGILELIRELPEDVTLVDLDVGRVILASTFATEDLSRGTPKNETTARALRTQVLSLAQCLGNVFGSSIDPSSWSCDRLLFDETGDQLQHTARGRFPALKAACHDFLHELLAGATSCCYWIEEARPSNEEKATSTEITILFDEDRFFRIKDSRQKHPFMPLLSPPGEGTKLAMGMDKFNLILEVFLRCQSMNAYIGTREPQEMIFAL